MGVRYLDNWVDSLSDGVWNEFAATLGGLQVLPRQFWRRPQFDLRGEPYQGIGEIRFRAERKQFRVFGFFGPRAQQFTLLHACIKQRSDISNEMDIAAQRKHLLAVGRGTVYEFTIKRRP